MVKTRTWLFLWLASFVVASRAHDIRATQRRRLGRDKEKDEQFTTAPAAQPTIVGPMSVPPSKSPIILPSSNPTAAAEAPSAPPSAAPLPKTPSSTSFLPPTLFRDESSAATPTNVPISNTTALNDQQLVLFVLNMWLDPEVLQIALHLFEDDRTVNLEIVMTYDVTDGVAYELSVRDSSAWLSEDPENTFVKALNAYLSDAFSEVWVVRVRLVSELDGDLANDFRSGDEDALNNNIDDDDDGTAMLILVVALSASVCCCCLGIATLLLPSYRQLRRELRDTWSYSQDKEHRVLRAMGTEDTEERPPDVQSLH